MTTTSTPVDYKAPPPAALRPSPHRASIPAQQKILIGLLVLELLVFSTIGLATNNNFVTTGNFFEVLRLSVELGLLALAMTPVIVTGGIDLSVGSLLGLCAIVMGMLWHDAGLPLGVAVVLALGVGILGGGLNALLITRLRIPPLIVTLGTYSLFRGVAEGITGGAKNYTNFPASFLFLGQGQIGPVPTQVPILILAAIGFWVLLHRSTLGRALSAIGYSAEGARYAGIPVNRRIALTYILAGLASAVAAVIYTAHWGQAKADAGTGYELEAITAVVLGGTSIFGGRGSIVGTVMGLLAIAILKNGLGLAALPRELTAILTGLLLLAAIGLEWRPSKGSRSAAAMRAKQAGNEQELDMRNSQLAVLSIVILAAAVIVAGANFYLVRSIQQDGQSRFAAGPGPGSSGNGSTPTALGKKITIAMMPKSKGNAYFIACKKGAEEAAAQLGSNNVELIWDGPTDPDPAKQNEIVETWITRGVDVIAVAVENRGGISSVLRKARQKGIKVVTYDSDAEPDARDFFVNQATAQGIGYTLMDDAAQVMGGRGDFAIITASLTASNMNEWQKYIEQRRAEKYPDIHRVTVEPCDDKQQVAFDKANQIMNANPNVKLLMAICSPAVPGAAEAVKQSGRSDVKVVGLGLPNENKPYLREGITTDVVLWNTMDLGYLTVLAADDVVRGKLKPGEKSMQGGRLGQIEIQGTDILLGKPFTFTKQNIDQFDF
ncbi:MAG TPA: substrate-binding domain-containing protein [Tepidisphaeraceae bacterium]|jgi:rhamnose transport system permease protein